MRREMIKGINTILENNDIPWKFDERQDYPEDIPNDIAPGLFGDGSDKRIRTRGRSGNSGINVFPSDIIGDLKDDFLGVCGFNFGNKSLKAAFLAMADWAQAHANRGDRQRLTAVILTDKWNATHYEEQCVSFKSLNIHFVVILCVGEVPVQLPYVYTDRSIREFIESHTSNDEQIEAVKYAAQIIRSGQRADSLAGLTRGGNDFAYEVLSSAFGPACDEVLWDLNRALLV